ncbi:(Fe-S)-binding protein [bacterium]|nr:(Fe-S)-binding protein [bacterium]
MTKAAVEILRCLDCGKCTSACPVARYNRALSPRRLMRRLGGSPTASAGEAVWACLTCMRCDTVCPQEVPISPSVPPLRRRSRQHGEKPAFTRCSAIDAVAVLQSQADAPQQRLDWLTSGGDAGLKIDPSSKVMLWTGCTPYFDVFFANNGVRTLDAVRGAIRILNALGIAPAVRGDERCCGHDQLWSGDDETFEKLAALNVKMFESVAPELVVTVCPECQLTLRNEYQRRFGQPVCEIKHVAELVAERRDELTLSPRAMTVTFEDPCRLGRHQGKYDQPRAALAAVPRLELKEMPRNRGRAICCAGNWLACNQASKRIQTDLLRAAADTGGELLVTACPKCMVHLKCAQSGDDAAVPDIEIRDLAAVIAGALDGE